MNESFAAVEHSPLGVLVACSLACFEIAREL